MWRQKAIQIAPELKNNFQDPELSLYIVFGELLDLLKQAHVDNDQKRIKDIYEYAEWCAKQNDKTLWNAAGVSFYEHLCENELIFSQLTRWLKKDMYINHRDLIINELDKEKVRVLDSFYRYDDQIDN